MDPSTSQQAQHQQGPRRGHDRSGRGAGSGSADPGWREQLAGLLASLPAGAGSDLDPADGAALDRSAAEGSVVEGGGGSAVVDVSGLPVGVGAAVARVVQGFARAVAGDWPVPALRAPGRDGVGQEPLAEVADEHTPATATLAQGRQALAVLEAAEVAKAFLDGVAVEAAGVVATAYELHLNPAAGVPVGVARRAQLALAGRDGAAAEIQAATGMSATSARRLVRYARAGGARTATA
ncbi:MAG TPA: hypothetical protein VFL99_11585, partial [Segeticoccus sp.]|uniref:hypothetical protein n=1 Tax=Segeticoccus sp. TaxID=2706531 RepID=UPI002D800B3F